MEGNKQGPDVTAWMKPKSPSGKTDNISGPVIVLLVSIFKVIIFHDSWIVKLSISVVLILVELSFVFRVLSFSVYLSMFSLNYPLRFILPLNYPLRFILCLCLQLCSMNYLKSSQIESVPLWLCESVTITNVRWPNWWRNLSKLIARNLTSSR